MLDYSRYYGTLQNPVIEQEGGFNPDPAPTTPPARFVESVWEMQENGKGNNEKKS